MQLPFEYASNILIMQMFYVASKVDNSQIVQPFFFTVLLLHCVRPSEPRKSAESH